MSCCCSHENHDHNCKVETTDNQKEMLEFINRYLYLPVAKFVISSTKEHDFRVVALDDVFLKSVHQTMEETKQMCKILKELENQNLITIDYDILIDGYNYDEYNQSDIYKYFCKTVEEGKEKPNFLGDTASLEFGSIALTCKAQSYIESLEY